MTAPKAIVNTDPEHSRHVHDLLVLRMSWKVYVPTLQARLALRSRNLQPEFLYWYMKRVLPESGQERWLVNLHSMLSDLTLTFITRGKNKRRLSWVNWDVEYRVTEQTLLIRSQLLLWNVMAIDSDKAFRRAFTVIYPKNSLSWEFSISI